MVESEATEIPSAESIARRSEIEHSARASRMRLLPRVVLVGVLAGSIVGMAALFSATVQAPLTGIVLVVEMTGQNTLMLPLLLACLTAYIIPERLGAKPIYHALMDRELGEYRERIVEEPAAESSR